MCGIYLSVLVVGDLLVFPFLSKYVRVGFYFFFFKQKTASEFRISDWSSDVCSSDLLRRENLAAADAREAEEAEQAFLVIGCALGARLHLDDLALVGQHEIAVGFGDRILVIIEVEHRRSLVDAARNRADLVRDRILDQRLCGEQLVDREPHRDPRARDRGGDRKSTRLNSSH